MKLLNRIPRFSSAYSDAKIAISNSEDGDVVVKIFDREEEKIIGIKRFVGLAELNFDISPYLLSLLNFAPTTGASGIYTPKNRSLNMIVAAERDTQWEYNSSGDVENGQSTGTEANGSVDIRLDPLAIYLRDMLFSKSAMQPQQLATTMPLNRIIERGERDELTVIVDQSTAVAITATNSDGTQEVLNLSIEQEGLSVILINTNDFAAAEKIVVYIEQVGELTYSVIPKRKGSQRIAWRSSKGSIEHYTFLTTKEVSLKVDANTPQGEEHITLLSAFELTEPLRAISEILTSDDVWIVEQSGDYTPVEVLSREAALQQHGVVCAMELEICKKL